MIDKTLTYAVGLMSGTSLDGIDAALVAIKNEDTDISVELIGFETLDIPERVRKQILESSHPDTSSVEVITSLNMELGLLFSDAVTKVLESSSFDKPLDFVASHGQTIYHLPNAPEGLMRGTLQIGDPSFIAYNHKVPVVFNFRVMDMVVGGDGAPLVPYSEFLLYRDSVKTRLFQNIGGIGNVTVIPANASFDDVSAFDTGPGNMMINAATSYFYKEDYDKDGKHAANGSIILELLESLNAHPYLELEPPKSTGREMFGEDVVLKICETYPNNADDVIATLTRFTAESITNAYKKFIEPHHTIDEVVVGGGGAYNPVLMNHIKDLLPHTHVITQEDLGLSSDAKEAIAFAILGYETLRKKTNNIPSATGASRSVVLGQICPAVE